MKHINRFYIAAISTLMVFSSGFSMDLTQSSIWNPSQSSIFKPSEKSSAEQLSLSKKLIGEETSTTSSIINLDPNVTDKEYINFTEACSSLPHEFDKLRFTKQENDLNIIQNNITTHLSTLINFIESRDKSIINPQLSERIKLLGEIKEEIAKNPPYTDMLINQWKNIVDKSCSLTLTNIEKIKSGETDFTKSSLVFNAWPTTPEEQISYLETKNWELSIKTYILQLLWWKMRQTLGTVPKNSYAQKAIFEQMAKFGLALRNIGQNLPSIVHNKGQEPYPQFTFQLTKIPNNAAPELKNLLWASLTKEQKKMINSRKNIEKKLALHNNQLTLKEKLSADDYIEHNELLTEYEKILLPQDKKLKDKIHSAIQQTNEKINRFHLTQEEQKSNLEDLLLGQWKQQISTLKPEIKEEITEEQIEQERRERLTRLEKAKAEFAQKKGKQSIEDIITELTKERRITDLSDAKRNDYIDKIILLADTLNKPHEIDINLITELQKSQLFGLGASREFLANSIEYNPILTTKLDKEIKRTRFIKAWNTVKNYTAPKEPSTEPIITSPIQTSQQPIQPVEQPQEQTDPLWAQKQQLQLQQQRQPTSGTTITIKQPTTGVISTQQPVITIPTGPETGPEQGPGIITQILTGIGNFFYGVYDWFASWFR